jgi:hypothetical protein
MKRTVVVFVVIFGVAVFPGCGGKPHDLSQQVNSAKNRTEFPKKDPEKQTPEYVVAHLESSEDRADCLRQYGNDPKFDPKKHVEMLKQYENDPNPEVSAAAKELLAKAQ